MTDHDYCEISGARLDRRSAPKPPVHPDIIEVLQACEEYFDNRADADHNGVNFVANEEMRLLIDVRAALKLAGG